MNAETVRRLPRSVFIPYNCIGNNAVRYGFNFTTVFHMRKITDIEVQEFLNGHNPMEGIIDIECGFQDDSVSIIYVDKNGTKRIKKDGLKPFLWANHETATSLFDGNRSVLRTKLKRYGIRITRLATSLDGEVGVDRVENGYKYLFQSTRKMSWSLFTRFFQEGGIPIYNRKKKGDSRSPRNTGYMSVPPIEQYMISTGCRLFKGYENYNDLLRLMFDLETQGLNPRVHRIEQIGIRTNRGFEKVIGVEGDDEDELNKNELAAIDEFLSIIARIKPDIILGHNSENFDWDFLIVRCEVLGANFSEMSSKYFRNPIYKKKRETVLKLGGEVEYYFPTIIWGHNVLDSLHAARRAQAIDSNMKKSSLKYVTEYLGMKKDNRVYVPGDRISSTWGDTDGQYAFNDTNGDWYKISDNRGIEEGYEIVSGRYIVERYLLDDLWETDKIEERLNEANFLVGKLIPTTFSRTCTMGTAGIWKLIMLAWSYENGLAIPAFGENKKFVGGLSRLLSTGFIGRQVKLDYNSLYPSVILTWGIDNDADCSGVLNQLLNYVLGQREKYKELKAEAGRKIDELTETLKSAKSKSDKDKIKKEISYWKAEKNGNDKKQLPLKILGNSYFGSAGNPAIFPWGNVVAAERTTSISRQMLRLMVSHFQSIGYAAIVGDSFTSDTPLFIKYDDTGYIDIKPVGELIGETETDALGREYDTSDKPYKVLCRSGWMKPQYIYRHKTEKPLYAISEGDMDITVTEDHSLFDDKRNKIKPSEITGQTELEYYDGDIELSSENKWLNERRAKRQAQWLKEGYIDRVPYPLFNTNNKSFIKAFLDELGDWDYSNATKTCKAGIQFLTKRVNLN